MDARTVDATLGEGCLRIGTGEPVELLDGWVAPSYGVRRPAPVLRVTWEGTVPFELETTIAWRPADPGARREDRA